jgi:beta-glucosidase
VLVGRASGEAMDTDSLRLIEAQEQTIRAVAAANPRTLVVTAGSGPIVMPWRDQVAAILHVGQAGERLAPALAAVVTGAAEPGGRSPFTIPAAEADVPLTAGGYPGVDGVAEYDEGMHVGYRGYEARGVTPAFAFGHGLGYTSFEVAAERAELEADELVFRAEVRNTGSRVGKFVAQLYVASPAADSPRALRGFAIARPRPGEAEPLEIHVPLEDLREFDEGSGSWVRVPGVHRVDVGTSSAAGFWSGEIVVPAD